MVGLITEGTIREQHSLVWKLFLSEEDLTNSKIINTHGECFPKYSMYSTLLYYLLRDSSPISYQKQTSWQNKK